jgi:parallel beta-helix repeat protein
MNILFLLLILIITGCGDSEVPPVSPEEGTTGLRTLYVDVENGNDNDNAEAGSADNPFTSVSYALTQIDKQSDYTIVVKSGMYTDATEQFPIIARGDIEIVGELIDGGPIFTGKGLFYVPGSGEEIEATFVVTEDARLKAVNLKSTAEVSIYSYNSSNQSLIQNVVIDKCKRGLLLDGKTENLITNNLISNCSNIGIEISKEVKSTLKENKVFLNSVGVLIDDFSAPVFEYNTIIQNTKCDLVIRAINDINLVTNIWDDDPFNFVPSTSCSDGNNIVVQGSGNIIYRFIPKQFIPSFQNTVLIDQIEPRFGEFINTTTPDFFWTGTTTEIQFIAVFTKPPQIRESGISNVSDIIWTWNPGLGTGSIGSVEFKDGGSPMTEDLFKVEAFEGLDKGRTYYWIVWQWNEEGLVIDRSSQIGYFSVRF